MTQSEPDDQQVQVSLAWPHDLTSQAQPANMFTLASDSGSSDVIYLTIGHVGPPIWMDAESAQEAFSRLGGAISVQPRGAFVLSRTRAAELHRLLGDHLEKFPAGGSG